MMIDMKGLWLTLFVLAVIGAGGTFILWAFRIVSAWAILAGAIGVPLIVMALLFLLFVGAWMASGSH